MSRFQDRAATQYDAAEDTGRGAIWLAVLCVPVICATMVQAQDAAPARPASPLPQGRSRGFQPTTPRASGQILIPPRHQASGVIVPPTVVDRGIGRPTPPGDAFPMPVVKPPG